jgi:hypothetical protein
MKAPFVWIALAMIGTAACTVGCSSESEPAAGGGSSHVTVNDEKSAESVVWQCELIGDADGQIVRLLPEYSERHRIDLKNGTFAMDDGLQIDQNPFRILVSNEDGKALATIDKYHSYYSEETGKAVTGHCDASVVTPVKPTSDPLAIEDGLEYSCHLSNGLELDLRPKAGEIDEIDAAKGTFKTSAENKFDLDASAAQNALTVTAKDNSPVATLTETSSGVKIARGDVSGDCEKFTRKPQ